MKLVNIRKFISGFLCLAIMTNFFLSGFNTVYAVSSYVAKVTNDTAFRTSPDDTKNADGSNNIISEIDQNTFITIIDGNKIKSDICSSGFVKALINNTEGYVCSNDLTNPTDDAYDRPWNSPKKAITGGAKWIASGYISRGQFTSYLKKFNVNPNASSEMFNHQYMENIAAPSSEAATSYKAYLNNNLLSLPLVFNIPVYADDNKKFDNTKYDRPTGNLATIEVLDTVVDQQFEDQLDAQGFPESYKRILRSLHQKYPNWTFIAMHTGVDFTYAVEREKVVGAIQGNTAFYEYSNGSPISSEPGWYRPNFETTAYYMDPRNFLTEKYILQFESLEYSEVYTEEVVQTILNNTFMSDMSIIDNQSYKSIFVEAGKLNNISPVYLASLAKQESGTNGSGATNGLEFTYQGITYSGLFNFFNIGANSSAENPLRQGLVYASGDYCRICGNYTPVEIPGTDITVVPAGNSINNLGLQLVGGYLQGFTLGTDINNLVALDVHVSYNTEGLIKTGTVLTFSDGTKYEAVIKGDLTGDGVINSADILRLRQHLLGNNILKGSFLAASDLTGDNTVNSADILKIRQYLLGQTNISQL